MKAISVRQPWAEFIISGKKTIEIRKLNTKYRGLLMIHAASIRGTQEFQRAELDRTMISSFTQQAIIGVVELVDIKLLDKNLWEALKEKHLLPGSWSPFEFKYAWFLEKPRRIQPISYIGLPAIFSVNQEIEIKVLKSLSKS
jgi:hypothetical protein